MSEKIDKILEITGRSLDELKANIIEALEYGGYYFDPELLDELQIEIVPEEVKD